MSLARTEQVGRALAWSFLAAPEWTAVALLAQAQSTLGRRHRWLPAVVRAVLADHRTAPSDRAEDLAVLIAGFDVLQVAVQRARRRGTPVRVARVPTSAAAMGRRRWPVPVVDDLAALARLLEVPLEQLAWVADVQGRQRRTAAGPLHLYRYRWVQRPGAAPRLLEAPTPLLRAVLRRLLTEILLWVPVSDSAYGFVRGRSALDHARRHVGADLVVGLDLRHFFAAVTAARVGGLFATMAYPDAVRRALTGLVTHRTPVHVLSAMPPGGDTGARHLLRARLRAAHLPQGAPTSPALANLACFVLDRRLGGYAAAVGATYSRYADDLTFSGPATLSAPRLVGAVARIVQDEAFQLNPAKTRVRRSDQRQVVTGLVVNDRPGVGRAAEDRLRAALHEAVHRGPSAANRAGHPDFRAHLEGRVGWVESVNPVRGARLRRQLEAVDWAGS